MARYFSVWDIFEQKLRTSWHTRLLVLTDMGLVKGWHDKLDDVLSLYVHPETASVYTSTLPEGARAPRSVRASNLLLNRLRRACKNESHLVNTILANPCDPPLGMLGFVVDFDHEAFPRGVVGDGENTTGL